MHFIADIPHKAIVENDGKVLAVFDGHGWELPGGRLDVGEQPRDALARELREELGATLKEHELHATYTQVCESGCPHYVVVFRCTVTDPAAITAHPDEGVTEIRWVASRDELAALHFKHREHPQLLHDVLTR